MGERHPRDAVITGVGLVSCLADGAERHAQLLLGNQLPTPPVDNDACAPYPFYPLVEIDLKTQIPRRGDIRQMEDWQRYGTYGAGLALEDAGLKEDLETLAKTHLIVSAGGGERDPEVDTTIVEGYKAAENPGAFLNEHLMNDLRPTLFLAQLTNLLAGNISLVHHVVGSSRSFMGEEMAGAMAIDRAHRQLKAGQGDVYLVGGSYNAARVDMVLYLQLAHYLLRGTDIPSVWAREAIEGGVVTGSMSAFLVIEAREHAEERGAKVYAKIDGAIAERGKRDDAEKLKTRLDRLTTFLDQTTGPGALGVLSGASGATEATRLEKDYLESLSSSRETAIRGVSNLFGHGIEAQFPLSCALAALALDQGSFFAPFDDTGFEAQLASPPSQIAISQWGYWRGEALAVLSADTA